MVSVGLSVGCATADLFHLYVVTIVVYLAYIVVLRELLPVAVLIINAMLIRELRRVSNYAAASLEHQQHHQSTSSNSAVPTVMLITTSLVYVLLCGSMLISLLLIVNYYLTVNFFLPVSFLNCHIIFAALWRFVFAYNFYVYLITGKQFRSELRTLFCRSSCSSSSTSAAAAAARDRNDVELARRGQAQAAV